MREKNRIEKIEKMDKKWIKWIEKERGGLEKNNSIFYSIIMYSIHTLSIMNVLIPCSFLSGSVLAYTTSTSASGPLVIQNLEPFNM